jgi:peptidoglycan/LPS O-acetylase OafA/YrhL
LVDSTQPKRYLPTLDGWRAVAILLVTAFHASQTIWGDRPDIVSITQFGALGVDLFFGLSGLLITKLLLEEQDRYGSISLQAFYVRRCFRVLLPCYIYVGFVCACSLVQNRTEILSSVFFFRNYLSEAYVGPYTIHLWSLAVEEHFYLLWPPLLVLFTTKHGRQVAMWLSVACGLWRIAGAQYFPPVAGAPFEHFRTDYRIDTLLWGCVIAFLLHDPRTLGQLKLRLTPTVWTLALAAFMLCLLFYSPLSQLWMPMLIPVLLAGTLTHPDWTLSRVLDFGPIRAIGRLSYSLYLWQLVFLVASIYPRPHWWQRFPANLVMAFLTAIVSYYFVETPLLRVGYRLSKLVSNRRSVRAGLAPQAAVPQLQ